MTKTCIVTGQFPPQLGGVGHSAHRVANMLADRGMNVSVVAFQKHPEPLPFDDSYTSTQEGNVLVHRVKVYNPGPDSGKSELEILTRYNREMFDALNFFQTKFNYEVLHGFFLYPAAYIAGMVGKMHGKKVIASVRGNDIGKYVFDPIRMPLVKSAMENADFITSVATSLLDLGDRAVTPISGKAKTILNSINFEHLAPKKRPDLPLNGLVIGSMGLFRYKKGMVYLCKALGELKHKYEFTLLLAGDYFKEEDREPHLQYFRENGLEDRVIVTGRIPHQEIADYLQLFDIMVFPSLFSEGCPLSMLEGMAMKKAVIGSTTGAIPEIIRHRENGILVPPASSDDIKSALVELIENPGLRRQLGENAGLRIDELSQEREHDEWLAVYQRVLQHTEVLVTT